MSAPCAPAPFIDVETVGAGEIGLLAVHGIQGTRASWQAVAAELSDACSIALPNLRGRGSAWRGRGPQEYTLRAYASELQAVASAHADARPFFLAGWSMGVSVVLEYLQLPDAPRPLGLILLSGSPCLCETQWFHASGDDLRDEIARREARLGLKLAADHDAVAWTWEAIRHTDQSETLRDIDLPVLILHGSADEDSPWPHAVRLRKGIAGAELVTLEGAGHGLLTQNTAEIAQQMRRFIDTHSTARKASLEKR